MIGVIKLSVIHLNTGLTIPVNNIIKYPDVMCTEAIITATVPHLDSLTVDGLSGRGGWSGKLKTVDYEVTRSVRSADTETHIRSGDLAGIHPHAPIDDVAGGGSKIAAVRDIRATGISARRDIDAVARLS